MVLSTREREGEVVVECPETHSAWRVRVFLDDRGRGHVRGCSRFWGGLSCDVRCESRAAQVLREVLAVEEDATPPVYCGRPNLAAPRPREPKRASA